MPCTRRSGRARSPASRSSSTTSSARGRTTAWPACWSPRTARPCPRRPARCARARRCGFRPRRSRPRRCCPISTSTRATPLEFGRMEATASDPSVQQQYGMIVGIPNAGQVNALATLNIRGERSVTCRGDFDRHPSQGPLPPGRAAGVRGVPPLPRRAGARGRAGRDVRPQSRPRDDADVRRRVLVQGPVRHEGHAQHGRRRRRLRHRLPGARPRPGRAIAQQGRHHLRQGRVHRVQRPRRRSRRPARAATRSCRRRSAISAAAGAATRRTPTTPRARLARLELGLGALRQRQPRHGESRRGDARLDARAREPQRGRARSCRTRRCSASYGGAIGADIYCDRTGILCRTIADCAKVLDALKDPVEGYYDPRDPFTTVPRSSVLSTPYASHATMPAAPGALARHAASASIRESMVYPPGSMTEVPIVTAAAREIKSVLGSSSARRWSNRPIPHWTRDPDLEVDEDRLPPRAGAARAGVHARSALPPGPGRPAGVQGVRGRDRADGVRCPARSSAAAR